ncbi:8-demethyl-8-alpha-L-rhamnosyltetracenomycin-C 2'-O-methyltransferase [Streptomyces sp. TLI_053]|uniref:class I SAM-dependent methyltransferase n=1 Tax=Streptomyces sp. TLI_053 TaxID=1855352 RepID=UPI00087B78EB|nr:class I SAM-dependent methyltransferase [Streptomyces sp. TLI_053]SDS62355.1 8-demethyl-8-alpha-L-rhamnosyltetracenomycin-C 2'-O-methyltransferase [Streptomyces sp. TLI_053]
MTALTGQHENGRHVNSPSERDPDPHESDLRRIHALILAADGPEEQLAAVIRSAGAERTAAALVDELAGRADLSEQLAAAAVVVEFELAFDGQVLRHHLLTGPKAEHRAGPAEEPGATVALDLLDLARAVFGARHTAGHRAPVITWHGIEDPARLVSVLAAFPVVQQLLRGLTEQPVDLAELSLRHGSDKWGLHYYTDHYARHFAPLRDRPLTVLELGIGGYADPAAGGGSLRMWKRFFRRGLVYGVDVYDKTALREQRIHTVRGDQADPAFLTALAERIGPIDIVIDDGSHHCPDVIAAFGALFPHVVPGGLYVIEDLQTSYWPGFGGSSERLGDPTTSMGFLKQLLDGLNHEEHEPTTAHRPSGTDRTLAGAHFYHNLAILDKGRNEEGTLPAWIPRRELSAEEIAAARQAAEQQFEQQSEAGPDKDHS